MNIKIFLVALPLVYALPRLAFRCQDAHTNLIGNQRKL